MPLIPRGLGKQLLERVKTRLKTELGLTPAQKPPARSLAEKLMRIREAVRHDPPLQLWAMYQGKHAPSPTWRYLRPYELKYNNREQPSIPNLYAECEKEGYKIECFRLDRFKDIQVSNIPFTPNYPFKGI